MSLPLPARPLPARAPSPRRAGLRATLRRVWAHLWAEPTPKAHLNYARARAALQAEYAAHLDLSPDATGRRAPLAVQPVQPGGDWR